MLKIKFWRIENSLAMKVLKQGEEITRGDFKFSASNGITIKSKSHPQITKSCLYVRGNDISLDKNIFTHDFDNVETAKYFLKMYVEATNEYNNSLSLQKSENKENDIEIVVAE